uniref:Sidoreflexin n=1 Tax=Rhabditophanes sp. KR3021 TaxID=114890 RepID=A0AC35TKS0_9BILA
MAEEKIFGFPKYPKFLVNQPRYPQETFLGRYLHYLDVINPSYLFTSDKKLEECKQLLRDYQEGKAGNACDKKLWKAKMTCNSVLHPDTGEKILQPFRMSGYVPFGWITVTGLLLPNPSWPQIIFWQWMNQSHNAAVNYANRNATKEQPLSVYAKSYAIAVSAAVGISTTLTWFIKRADRLDSAKKLLIQRFVPLPAVSLASTLNVLSMRLPEVATGVEVYERDGTVVGTSKVAAKQAVFDTALTRAFLPFPLLLAPPLVMPFIEKKQFMKNPRIALLMNAIVCTISFAVSLPISLALFPQESEIDVSKLEKEIQEKCFGQKLYYNKGM